MANFNIQPFLQQVNSALQGYQDYQSQKVNQLPQQIMNVLQSADFQKMLNPTVNSALTSGRYVQQKAGDTANRMLSGFNTMYNSLLPHLFSGYNTSAMLQPYLMELQAMLAEQQAQSDYDRQMAEKYPWGIGGPRYVGGSILNPVAIGSVANPGELNNTPLAAHTAADANRRAQQEMGQTMAQNERDNFSWYQDRGNEYRTPVKERYPNTSVWQQQTEEWNLPSEQKTAETPATSSNLTNSTSAITRLLQQLAKQMQSKQGGGLSGY